MDTKTIKLPDADYYMLIGILGELKNKGELKIIDESIRLKIADIIYTLWKSGS